jgi:prepilin signal peptidase PulO-like enzyme (type II secretory pathway)
LIKDKGQFNLPPKMDDRPMLSHPEFLYAWMFVIGSVIGSFLNVVIYRLPRGMSLLHPASSCPQCGHVIRWFDNVPILGWLWLRGRCRDCKAKISIRYPIVEAATAVIFVALAYTAVVAPYSAALRKTQVAAEAAPPQPRGAQAEEASPSIPTDRFFATYAYHLVLLCALLAAALIDFDGQKLPRRLITWPSGVGILWAVYWPAVQALPLAGSADAEGWLARLIAFATCVVGMLAAVVLRLGIFRFMRAARPRELGLWNATLALYAVGAFLGFPAVIVIGGAALIWALTTQDPSRKMKLALIKPTALVFALTLAWCLLEHHLQIAFTRG